MRNFMSNRSIAARAVLLAALALPVTATADSGFYIGVSAGGATLEADTGDIAIPGLPSSIDEDDTATEIFAGYKFDLPVIDIGIEAGYVDFGEPEIDLLGETLFVDTTGINVWGIAALNVGLFDIYGKLGYLAWDVDARFIDESITEDGSDLGYGLGAEFEIGPVLIRGELERYDLDDTDITMLSLGVAYQF